MSDLPFSVSRSEIRLFGVDLVVHQLNTGDRIIEADGMLALLDAMASGSLDTSDVAALQDILPTNDRGTR